ncbi:MAG: carboxypeptidase-like regulatory domain-containing protein, partial [Bacteroidota bacterium]
MRNINVPKQVRTIIGLLTLIFITTFVTHGQTTTGTITGTISTTDGNPLEFATLALEGTNLGAISNKSGQFTIENVPAGTYTLIASIVGYQTIERELTITSEQTATLKLNTNEATTSLDEVQVSGTREFVSTITGNTPRTSIDLLYVLLIFSIVC